MASYPWNDIPRPQSSHGYPNVYPPQTGPYQDFQATPLHHCYSSPAQMEGSGMPHNPWNSMPRPQSSHGYPNVYPLQTGPCQDFQATPLHHCYSSPAQMEGSGMPHNQRSGSCSCRQDQYSQAIVYNYGHHGHPLHSASVPSYGLRHPNDHATATFQIGNSIPDHLKCLPLGKLLVTVGEARGIKGDDFLNLGKGDPFCIVQLGNEKDGSMRETAVRKGAGSTPLWNEVLVFPIKEKREDYNLFILSLWNRNKARHNTFLGDIRIEFFGGLLAMHKNNVPEYWYPIYDKSKPRGDISLVFDFIPMHAENMLKTSTLITEPAPRGKYVESTRRYKMSKMDWMHILAGVGQVAVGGVALGATI